MRILGHTFKRRGIVVQLGDNGGIVVKFDLKWYQMLPKAGKKVNVPKDAEVSPHVFPEFQERAAEMQGRKLHVKQVQLIGSGPLSIVHSVHVDSDQPSL